MMPNAWAYLLVQLATLRAHAGIVQIGYRLKATEVAHVLGNARPRLLVCHEDHEAVVRMRIDLAGSDAQVLVVPAEQSATRGALPTLRAVGRDARVEAQTRDSSASVMVYTSGTTGKPRGRRPAPSIGRSARRCSTSSKVGIRHDERHLVVCPLYHSAAPAFVALTYGLGGTGDPPAKISTPRTCSRPSSATA